MEEEKSVYESNSGEITASNVDRSSKDVPMGILRLDVGKPNRLSAEFKSNQKEVVPKQSSTDRLSVTFAEDSLKSKSSRSDLDLSAGLQQMQQLQKQLSMQYQQDKVQFPEESVDGNESDEEDYSASVNAIIQRRASTRRSKKLSRRASSPFTPDTPGLERRRSSVFTTSSGDTAITVDDNPNNDVTQDEIFENIKLHKEVLSHVKMQPWNMRKKLKLVLQAKAYIKKHEGQLQERLAQSHSTKDMLARWNIVLIKKWQKWKREITNMSMWFIPWELKIKEIESHFGSVVASYFIFLRWLFWVNIVIAVVIISFVTIPEIITADPEAVKDRKFVLPEEKYNSTNFLTLWDFEGVFKYSPLFYGWYTNRDYNDSAVLNSYDRKNNHGHGYRLPFAYFVTGLVVYAYSFFATLRKMAENSRMSKLSEKDDECIFSWKVFTAWDYMIGNAETAHNRVASIVMGFKEALLEEAEKKRESRNWKIICFRVLVNTLVLGLLSFSVVAVVIVVRRSTEPEASNSVWRRNEITVVITLISFFFPMLFEVLGLVEQYHPRKQLRLQLARIMVLNLLNLYSLIFALFDKITDMTILLQEFKTNLSKTSPIDNVFSTTPMTFETTTQLYDYSPVPCFCNDTFISNPNSVISLDMISSLAQNLSLFALPKLKEIAAAIYNENFTEVSMTTDNTWTGFTDDGDGLLNTSQVFFGENSSYFDGSTSIFIPDNSTFYQENSSLFWNDNITDYFNSSTFNNTDTPLDLMFNETFSFEDLRDMFVDYLTFILSPFVVINSTTSWNNSLSNSSMDTQNITEEYLNMTTEHYVHFKTTIAPLFNNTVFLEEQRFDTELTTVFEDISTTIATTLDSFTTDVSSYTTTQQEEIKEVTDSSERLNCLQYCKWLFETTSVPQTSQTITSTALVPLNYGDADYRKILNYTMNAKLRSLCWETMFGQELLKLTLLDLIMSGLTMFFMDFIRGIFVRFMNRCWCWDLEKKFPQYGDFKVAENILHLVNNQGMVWMGMFFSPGLVVLNVFKLYIMMYMRAWAVLTCNVPHEIIFRASRSNNFYYALLLMMLFLCVLPVGYAIVWIEPSWHCGPFSGYPRIFHIFTNTIRANVPEYMHRPLDYIASPGIVIPLLLLLVLIIYYLVSLTSALREANNDLKTQLRRERTEERRKMFQLADKRRRCGSGESNDQTPFSKWKKLMGNLPSTRSCDEARQESEDIVPSQKDDDEEEEEKAESKGKVFFTKLIKKALGKTSSSDEEQDATDTDQHDSLPYDNKNENREANLMKSSQSGASIELNTLQSIVSRWSLRRNSNREEKSPEDQTRQIMETAKPDSDVKREGHTNKDKGGKTKNIFFGEDDSRILNKDNIIGTSVSALDVSRPQTPKSPFPQKYEVTEKKPRKSPRKQKHSRHHQDNFNETVQTNDIQTKKKHSESSGNDENSFLKRVLEAKKSGAFRDDVVLRQNEPKAGSSHEKKHKKQREKDGSKLVKPKPPIIEHDEEFIDDDQSSFFHHSNPPKRAVVRQDSSSSNWSDKIPVITISKTNSDENIPRKDGSSERTTKSRGNCERVKEKPKQVIKERRVFVFNDSSDEESDSESVAPNKLESAAKGASKFSPKVRCALRKQVTAIDEDVIIHFSQNLEQAEEDKKMLLTLSNKLVDDKTGASSEDNHLIPTTDALRSEDGPNSDKSTSEDTEAKDDGSSNTILNSPYLINESSDEIGVREGDKRDSVESQADLELEPDTDGSIELETSSIRTEEIGEAIDEESSGRSVSNVLQLQRPSMKSSSRSQTESSSYYRE